jgi:bifunctional DNA-binding transcriptional regulator/antitoxin component of YhaV-PrlF toxin-antitoxin module
METSIECGYYKAMRHVTLSAKNQTVLPRQAREALRVEACDKLLVVVHGERVIVLQKPKSHTAAIRSLGMGGYSDGYLQEERNSWD